MEIDRLCLDEGIGETRAAAFAGGRAVSLFTAPLELSGIARLGEVRPARIRAPAPGADGWFVELDTGEEAFLRKMPEGLSAGAAFCAQIASEARRGKLARVRPVKPPSGPQLCAMELWHERLPGRTAPDFESGREAREAIDAAFDEALSPAVTLPGGGRLTLTRTRALTAIDIDTAGRSDSGRAGARARKINLAAVREAARQLCLRGLGGLAVIDCIAPLSRPLGSELRSAFLAQFRSVSTRRAEALAPSPFGLLEVSMAWGERPVDEIYLSEDGTRSPLGTLLAGLRRLEAEAEARPGGMLTLSLPGDAMERFNAPGAPYADRIASRYGRRIRAETSGRGTIEVY